MLLPLPMYQYIVQTTKLVPVFLLPRLPLSMTLPLHSSPSRKVLMCPSMLRHSRFPSLRARLRHPRRLHLPLRRFVCRRTAWVCLKTASPKIRVVTLKRG